MPYRPNFPIAETDITDTCCLCIEVPDTDRWRAIVAGLLSELRYWYNWERDGTDNGAKCAAIWKPLYVAIDWSKMSCCCDDITILYIWTEEGELEQSTDGGETYDPVPEKDPRNSSPVYPPVTGEPSEDKSCIAATGMTLLIKEQIGDQLTEDMSRYTLGQLVHDWVTTILETSNPFEALIQIAVNQIFALLVGSVITALTEEVYSQLTCIFLAWIEDDLSFTEAGWEGVRAQILTDITGIAGVFLEHLVFLLGKVGLTNLARSQAATEGDCEDCGGTGCDLDLWEVTTGYGDIFGNIVSRNETTGEIVVETTGINTNSAYYIDININQNHDSSLGCYVVAIDGAIGAVWQEPPAAFSVAAFSSGLIAGHCVNHIQISDIAPFTVTITLGTC